ncbi:D-alanyl-D-alanine carboxypeptidase family protein (macronuclear) [Tetrahymena thermophila SB210]|uniref:D-alanyl-D-alanine carboxypeptidase family protein n=1 Tax=Tetrahymena thermophila (strain SB210) TaxID=312017 RepID=I7MFG1_TETTS|nr:D-alanyl-D-alanine carboxypeptidase family protein [Tetrahymena thermophila SB210]EAR83921.2 D-alanyl-D-alanine carboxypeptidase family protein [Tetrahymena thermophila SB210]|eukprot:XP_001031584.2 D-alanyl-D-alanine carboxypeptidase family protein [Tetrahymena thermophila SB210]
MSDNFLAIHSAPKIMSLQQIQINNSKKTQTPKKKDFFRNRGKGNLSPLRAFSVNQTQQTSQKKEIVHEQNYFIKSKDLDNSFEIKGQSERDQSVSSVNEIQSSLQQKKTRSLLYIKSSNTQRLQQNLKKFNFNTEQNITSFPSFNAFPKLDQVSNQKIKSSINLESSNNKKIESTTSYFMNFPSQKSVQRDQSPILKSKQKVKSYTFMQDEKNQMLMTQILFRKPKLTNKYYQIKPPNTPQIKAFDLSIDKRNKTSIGFQSNQKQNQIFKPQIQILDENSKDECENMSPVRDYFTKLPQSVSAESWAVLNANNGQILFGNNHFIIRQMASLTKIMTLYVSLKVIQALDISPFRTYVEVSKKAASMNGTSARLIEGDRLSLWDLMHGMMLPSGNDAATALAENLGVFLYYQSEEYKLQYQQNPQQFQNEKFRVKNSQGYFINQMNKYAHNLQLNNTHFANPTGLVNNFNRSTAADLAKLSYHLIKEEQVKKIVECKYHFAQIYMNNNKKRSVIFENTNKLLSHGYSGLKTGITTAAGPCLSAWYKDDQVNLIIILLNSSSMEQRWVDTQNLVSCVINQQQNSNVHSSQLP